jgi:hypothetical protein
MAVFSVKGQHYMCTPTVKCCPNGHLTQKHVWGSQDTICSALSAKFSQMLCLRFHVAEMAQGQHAHLSGLTQTPDSAGFQIHTSQPR